MLELFVTSPWIAFAAFATVGFVAQLLDGALGMAYGAISSTVLMGLGVPPAVASAAVHAAECVTTGASGASHLAHRNVDFDLLMRLAPAGVLGGVMGAYVLTGLDPMILKALIAPYLMGLGLLICWRAFRGVRAGSGQSLRRVAPLGLAGGFLDASGGGGWGPLVSSTLIGSGHPPRHVIGTVNASEFFVAVAISATFLIALITGRMPLGLETATLGVVIAGLIAGGVLAAPLAGLVTRIAPPKTLLAAVGAVIVALAGWQAAQTWPHMAQSQTVAALTAFVAR